MLGDIVGDVINGEAVDNEEDRHELLDDMDQLAHWVEQWGGHSIPLSVCDDPFWFWRWVGHEW